MAASLVLCATGASGESPAQRPTFPEARIETYRDGAGRERIYRVQEPDALLKSPNILIYMLLFC
jgi:hypothetical protein